MRSVRFLIAILACVCSPVLAGAQGGVSTCQGQAPDACLIDQARGIAETLRREDQRDEVYFSVATALAARGQMDAAMAAVDRIDHAMTRAEALGELSGAAARQGDFDRALKIALSIVDTRNRSARVMALERLGVLQAAAGNPDAAFTTVIAIDNPYRRSQAQAAIATAVARTGDTARAIRAATRIATDYWFTADQHAYKVASGLVARTGEFDQFWFYEALANIAEAQARRGEIVGALQTAQAIPDMPGRSRALARVAAAQADAGDIEGAWRTARRIEAPYGDLPAMVAIVRRMAMAGDVKGALDIAGQLETAYGDVSGMIAVAVEQAHRDGLEAALTTARRIGTGQGRAQAHAAIAERLARDGRPDDAVRPLALIADAGDRADAAGRVAVILAGAGDAARALKVITDLARPRDYNELAVAVVLAQAGKGDVNGAVATAAGIGDAMSRAIALAGIARRLPG